MENDTAIAACAALGQDTRFGVVQALSLAGKDGMTAGELATQLDVLPNTLSANLAILLTAGLVSNTREGRQIRYRLNAGSLKGLADTLSALGARPEDGRT